jgi:hypothetical protein
LHCGNTALFIDVGTGLPWHAALSQAAARKANAFFDGVLPPFSNVGNTERGDILDAPTLRGIG